MQAVDRRRFLALAGALGLAGGLTGGLASCATPAPPPSGGLTFTNAPVRFNAAEVQFVDNYRPPLAAPNVEHTFSQTPAAAVRDWTRARIAAAGGSGVVHVTVHDASVVQVRLPTRGGFGGLFFDEQDTRYDAALEVSIEFAGANRTPQARSKVVRSQTLPESATVNQRNEVYAQLLKALMDDFDRQMLTDVRRYMGAVILN